MTTAARERDDEKARMVVRTFFVRARRVAAHSLMQKPEVERLEQLAQGTWNITLQDDGKAVTTIDLPSEEAMESLAARLRPFTLTGESVYHRKVIKALRRMTHGRLTDVQADRLDQFGVTLAELDLSGPAAQAFVVEGREADGKVLPRTSDTSLAGGWFYLDVAHTDAEGHKQAAEQHGIDLRYEAAAASFARLALVVANLLRFVRELRDAGAIDLDDDAEMIAVTANTTREREMRVFVAPIDTAIPAIGTLSPLFHQLNRGDVLGLDPARRVTLTFRGTDEQLLSVHEGVVVRQATAEGPLDVELCIDDCWTLFLTGSGDDVLLTSQWRVTNNRQLLGHAQLEADLAAASTAQLCVNGSDSLQIMEPFEPDDGAAARWRAIAAFFDDIVNLEQVASDNFPMLQGRATHDDVAMAHLLRMLAEGRIVQGNSEAVAVMGPAQPTPDRFAIEPQTVQICNISVEQPRLLGFHPQVRASSGGLDARDPALVQWTLSLPPGARWFVVSLDNRSSDVELADLVTEALTDFPPMPAAN